MARTVVSKKAALYILCILGLFLALYGVNYIVHRTVTGSTLRDEDTISLCYSIVETICDPHNVYRSYEFMSELPPSIYEMYYADSMNSEFASANYWIDINRNLSNTDPSYSGEGPNIYYIFILPMPREDEFYLLSDYDSKINEPIQEPYFFQLTQYSTDNLLDIERHLRVGLGLEDFKGESLAKYFVSWDDGFKVDMQPENQGHVN